MSRFYDEEFHYTDEAHQVREYLDEALRGLFHHFCLEDNASPRELAHVITNAVHDYERLFVQENHVAKNEYAFTQPSRAVKNCACRLRGRQ